MLKAEYDYFPFISVFYLLFKIFLISVFISELMVIVDCIQDKKIARGTLHIFTHPPYLSYHICQNQTPVFLQQSMGGGSLAHSAAQSLCSDNEKLAHISLR